MPLLAQPQAHLTVSSSAVASAFVWLFGWVQIYDQAVKKCPEKERLGLYEIYVARASEFFGIGKVRAFVCALCKG